METTIESIWTKSKILVKGGTIGLIALVLLIPVSFVSQLVSEREARQK
jgi:inner membrane protein